MTDINERAVIGGNSPPPVETHKLNIEDLLMEAQNHLDGEPITTQGQADAIGQLLDSIRKARGAADEQRKVEKRPHDDAGKAVQAIWTPLLNKCDTAAETAKKALSPWLEALAKKQRQEAAQARQEAMAAQRAALDAQRAAQASTDLAAQEKAKELTKAAERSASAANKAEKAKPQAAGVTRAIGLVSSWSVEVTDPLAFGKWLWVNRRAEYLAMLEQAAADFKNSRLPVPGLNYVEKREAR